jgi:hypothetical protein
MYMDSLSVVGSERSGILARRSCLLELDHWWLQRKLLHPHPSLTKVQRSYLLVFNHLPGLTERTHKHH